jgi:hypothetical protein
MKKMEIPLDRRERRKEKRALSKNNVNQQYSYTTREAIATFKDIRGDLNWLPSKEGQSIEQWWIDRVMQQRSASNLTNAKLLGCFGIHDNKNIALDNLVRKHICDMDYHQEVVFENDGAGKEWILTEVSDIYKELNFYPTCVDDILNNEEFLTLWFARIKSSKYSFFENNEIANKVYKLKVWQRATVDSMLGSGKFYHQLGLAPRFGKTLLVLDYLKSKIIKDVYDTSELWVVPLSKSLSSNESFINDYVDFGFYKYFNMVRDISLFVDEEKVIEKLLKKLPENAKVILVTDEADFASHTKISVERLNYIGKIFNVCEHIVMTGTGYGKATKIFKNVPIDDINHEYVTYSEMVEMGGEVVKRNIVNVQYDITKDFEEDVLNIRQTIKDPAKHKDFARLVHQWTLCEETQERAGLQESEIVMVFLKPETANQLEIFMKRFEKMYGNDAVCMLLTSNYSSNRDAEKDVKEKYKTMRKNGDNRKLIIFSMGMGNRSFGVSKINRVIEFIDSELTSATIQEFSRCLTFEVNKTIADIVRVGFTEMRLAEQLYLSENEIPDYGPKSNERVEKFLSNNSFANIIMDNKNGMVKQILGNNNDDISRFLDNLCKFVDTTNYITTRLINENIKVDAGIENLKKTPSKVVETPTPKSKIIKPNKSNNTLSKLSEKELRNYINVTRCIPSIMYTVGFDSVSDFVQSKEWKNYLNISSQLFLENYKTCQEFKGIIDALIRQYVEKSEQEHQTKVFEYLKIIG